MLKGGTPQACVETSKATVGTFRAQRARIRLKFSTGPTEDDFFMSGTISEHLRLSLELRRRDVDVRGLSGPVRRVATVFEEAGNEESRSRQARNVPATLIRSGFDFRFCRKAGPEIK